MVIGLSNLIVSAPSAPLRAFAGLCVLAVENSCGFREANRARNLRLTHDAIVGESRAKNHLKWLPWAACRRGISKTDWAAEWLEQLKLAGLPGSDFVLNGASTDGGKWLTRIAEHRDANAMYQMLLTLDPIGMSVEEASLHNFHGLKRLYPTMGIQLKAVGSITDERGIERLGHWSKNSDMPEAYNSESCVAELHTRSVIANAIRSGWKPAEFGCVPVVPVITCATSSSFSRRGSGPYAVSSGTSRRFHIVEDGPFTACGKLRCGTMDFPEPLMNFIEIADFNDNTTLCKFCEELSH